MNTAILLRLDALEKRVAFLEGRSTSVFDKPNLWAQRFTGAEPPFNGFPSAFSIMDCQQPQAHPERCGCKHDHDTYSG